MTSYLRDRILRKLDTLSDERLYQVLDYVDFLESRYAEKKASPVSLLQRFSDGVEDSLRSGGVTASTVIETMGLLNRAVGVLNGVAAAGVSVATDVASAAQRIVTPPAPAAPGAPTTGATGTGPAASGPAASAAPHAGGAIPDPAANAAPAGVAHGQSGPLGAPPLTPDPAAATAPTGHHGSPLF